MSLYPLSNTWDTKYVTVSNIWARKDTVTSYLTKYTLCTGDPEGIFDQNGGILKAPNSGFPSWDDRIELGLYWQEVKTPRSTPQAPQLRDVDVEDRTGKKEDAGHRPEGGGMGQEGHDRHKHEEGDGLSGPD